MKKFHWTRALDDDSLPTPRGGGAKSETAKSVYRPLGKLAGARVPSGMQWIAGLQSTKTKVNPYLPAGFVPESGEGVCPELPGSPETAFFRPVGASSGGDGGSIPPSSVSCLVGRSGKPSGIS